MFLNGSSGTVRMSEKVKRINTTFTQHEYDVISELGNYIGKSRSSIIHDIIEQAMPFMEEQLKLLNKARQIQERVERGDFSQDALRALESEFDAIRGRIESMQEQAHSAFGKMSDAMDSSKK